MQIKRSHLTPTRDGFSKIGDNYTIPRATQVNGLTVLQEVETASPKKQGRLNEEHFQSKFSRGQMGDLIERCYWDFHATAVKAGVTNSFRLNLLSYGSLRSSQARGKARAISKRLFLFDFSCKTNVFHHYS